MLDLFSAIQPLHGALDYHLERHNVLTSNVAHIDTPGYRPQDLARVDPADFAGVLSVEMARTAPQHLATGPANGRPNTGRVFEDITAGAGNDGNYVSLDREASKVAANHIRYDVVSAVTAAQIRQLMYAANDGRS